MDLYKLIKGIEALNKDTIPNWGKMNSSMMLMHCSRFIDVYLGKVPFNPIMFLFGFTFSIFHISYLKYIVRYDVNRYIRNLPTLRFFNTFKYIELDFDKEKDYFPKRSKIATNLCFTKITETTGFTAMDLAGKSPTTSSRGNKYVFL